MIKSAQVANLNIVFGDHDKPMLECFDTIMYPALASGIPKIIDENEYKFMHIDISKSKEGIYLLTGILVKRTTLEIKSDINDEGELIKKNERYSAAPYSSFVINLLNHRMIFMPNQKGSPTLANFRSMIRFVISSYIKQKNSEIEDGEKLEYAVINVVGIPSAQKMDEILGSVERINSLTLRFYPLNGDADYTEAFEVLTKDMREELGSKRGEIIFKSPKSISGVKKLLEKSVGTINPIIRGVTKTNNKILLKADELSEKYPIEVDDDADILQIEKQLVEKVSEIKDMKFTNNQHNEIYEKCREKIMTFVSQRR